MTKPLQPPVHHIMPNRLAKVFDGSLFSHYCKDDLAAHFLNGTTCTHLYYRIAGIFRGGKISWFPWLTSEPRNIYPCTITVFAGVESHTLRPGNSAKLPINIDCIFQLRVRSATESNNSKKRGQYGKCTPEQRLCL